MEKWIFPSKNHGEIEGYANPGLEMFKGNPLQALTREICQNSLDAEDDNKTVVVEFSKYNIKQNEFPGMLELGQVISLCDEFWKDNMNRKTEAFLNKAQEILKSDDLCVLRVSDFNTIGLSGAYVTGKEISPWIKLVKGNAISTKNGNSAGSYGIGKAAAFVNSAFQTVFYRTMAKNGEVATQGVARLMSFESPNSLEEDKICRSVGYYGNPDNNMPVKNIKELDNIVSRISPGTDLFIPGFTGATADGKWISKMICEILENFLVSIANSKLIVRIQEKEINAETLRYFIARNERKAKDAYFFNKIIAGGQDKIIEDYYDFHGMGKLHLRLLYGSNLNKKILVVRKSGMKITEISGLPKSGSYTGILGLEGYELNAFFREMENPQHDRWEARRHPDSKLAREYKNEVEDWVKQKINAHIENIAGSEVDLDTGDLFLSSQQSAAEVFSDMQKQENVIDTVKSIDISIIEKKSKTIKKPEMNGDSRETGKVDEFGKYSAIRSHKGEKGIKAGKSRGEIDKKGNDQIKKGMSKIEASVRSMTMLDGRYKLILYSSSNITEGEIEVISSGENGKGGLLQVENVKNGEKKLQVKNGKIKIGTMKKGEKVEITFNIPDTQRYALGVNLYGN